MSKAQVLSREQVVRDEVLKALAEVEGNYMLFVDPSHISIFIDMSTEEVEEQFIGLFEALETLKVQVEVIDINAKCRAVDEADISLTEAREAKSAIFIYL
ncbi:MAG: hypothetical protein QXK74_07175 [Candidatus Nitrosocaldaceae archaeon]